MFLFHVQGGGNGGPNAANDRYDENSSAASDWLHSKHMGKKGEFRYF